MFRIIQRAVGRQRRIESGAHSTSPRHQQVIRPPHTQGRPTASWVALCVMLVLAVGSAWQTVAAQTANSLTAQTATTSENAAVAIPADAMPLAGPVANEDPIPTKSLWEMLLAGGPLLVPILVCSFVLLLVVFERSMSLRRGRVLPRPFVKRMLLQLRERQIDREEALERCKENSSHVARVFAAALRKWGRPAVEVEQAMLDEGERVSNNLRRYLRVINGVATVSPLMGLLGTVWGMMIAFNAIATTDAMGRPELLAGGISQALLTTAAGLFVAIPALILYLFFVGRVDKLVMDIDARGQEVVNLISAEGLQQNRSSKSSGGKQAA